MYAANAQLEKLDYRKLHKAYSPKGRKSAAEPRIMFKLLVYGYMNEICATRKLEQACRKNVEDVFGTWKSNRQFKRFLMRGRTNISLELFLLCLAFDVRKYCAKSQQGRLKTHLFSAQKRAAFS